MTRYAQWMSHNAERVAKDDRLSADEKMIFVNAWNEWAEGTHLEPDQKHGFGYLKATRDVVATYASDCAQFFNPAVPKDTEAKYALILHVHYADVWDEMKTRIEAMTTAPIDIYVTVNSIECAKLVHGDFPNATIEIMDNRGRDIRPFIHMLQKIKDQGYTAIGKVHGKKSVYRPDGAKLRHEMLDTLLHDDCPKRFEEDETMGILVPQEHLLDHSTDKYMVNNMVFTNLISKEIGITFKPTTFPAGSMFWCRPEALAPLLKLDLNSFDVERGLVDGTRPHAIERLFCTLCEDRGFTVGTIAAL